ncbi:MAG: segregation/condensation protein A [Gammaproteobacteria bacterium 28-57-27]|nr:MAG: segregation/condensation protein A [Gammaproteobacteria bacterium 28-57-27]
MALNSSLIETEFESVARIGEQFLLDFPKDLYIPPDALAIMLEAFQGPLDLLLYLIRKQNINILDIPIAEVTRQYLGYIQTMQGLKLELAAEYLAMAAWLAEIKSRMLLPRPPHMSEEEADPRMELVRRLQDYEQLREASLRLDALPRLERDVFALAAGLPALDSCIEPPKVSMDELLSALRSVLQRAALVEHHHIQREAISLRERMELIAQYVAEGVVSLLEILRPEEGRRGVVMSFLALLELLKAGIIDVEREESGLFLIAAAQPT